MEKRGFLLAEETLKIILAVIVLIILVGLLAKLYYGHKNNQELLQAEATLIRLNQEISSLSLGVPKTFDIQNPVKKGLGSNFDFWVLHSWPYNGVYPKKCSNIGWDNCLCICKSFTPLPFKSIEQQAANKCDKIGVCFESQQISIVTDGVKVKGTTIQRDFLNLIGDIPFEVSLKREESQVKIDKV